MSSHIPAEEQLEPLASVCDNNGGFEDNYTPTRPPQYNDRNQPSGRVLPGGPSTVPRTVVTSQAPDNPTSPELEGVGQHYPALNSTATGVVDGVVTVAAASIPPHQPYPDPIPRAYVLFHVNRSYNGAHQPLTEGAIAALDHDFAHGSASGNVGEWIHGRSQFTRANPVNPSISVLQCPRTYTVTRTGSTVLSSWSIVSSTHQVSSTGHVADDVCAVGQQFADVSAPIGRRLLDEDL
ncbi:hypothetical protein EKO27_g6783 [Xylaria grammica]|uniref:Uncharacterized protein n=1 Tax=Xylaria grammica TaxID=363999 RepID=A0A439D1S3_9PEZI|nr:hypothetical protein EKO27_g6783 [Xylaria grammica]